MNATANNMSSQNRSGKALRPPHWENAAILFNTTRSYVRVSKEYPEAFLDPFGAKVSDGCGRMRCLRWCEDLFASASRNDLNGETLDEDSGGEESLSKKQRRTDITLNGGQNFTLKIGNSSATRSRSDRPENWREVAQYFISSNNFALVKQQFPSAFLNSDGDPATDSCAKMRALRWRDDFNIELLEGSTRGGNNPEYDGQIIRSLLSTCKDLIDQGIQLDEVLLQQLLQEELRKSDSINLGISESAMNTFGKQWAGRFLKRYQFQLQLPVKDGRCTSSSSDKRIDNIDPDNRLLLVGSSADSTITKSEIGVTSDTPSSINGSVPRNYIGAFSTDYPGFQVEASERIENWRDVAQLFISCGSYKTVKVQFSHVFLDDKKQPINNGTGKMLCQRWKEDLIMEHQGLIRGSRLL